MPPGQPREPSDPRRKPPRVETPGSPQEQAVPPVSKSKEYRIVTPAEEARLESLIEGLTLDIEKSNAPQEPEAAAPTVLEAFGSAGLPEVPPPEAEETTAVEPSLRRETKVMQPEADEPLWEEMRAKEAAIKEEKKKAREARAAKRAEERKDREAREAAAEAEIQALRRQEETAKEQKAIESIDISEDTEKNEMNWEEMSTESLQELSTKLQTIRTNFDDLARSDAYRGKPALLMKHYSGFKSEVLRQIRKVDQELSMRTTPPALTIVQNSAITNRSQAIAEAALRLRAIPPEATRPPATEGRPLTIEEPTLPRRPRAPKPAPTGETRGTPAREILRPEARAAPVLTPESEAGRLETNIASYTSRIEQMGEPKTPEQLAERRKLQRQRDNATTSLADMRRRMHDPFATRPAAGDGTADILTRGMEPIQPPPPAVQKSIERPPPLPKPLPEQAVDLDEEGVRRVQKIISEINRLRAEHIGNREFQDLEVITAAGFQAKYQKAKDTASKFVVGGMNKRDLQSHYRNIKKIHAFLREKTRSSR
ncbi:hypothetical protein HYV73_02510 [Candidatus Uhrbacteria bacterium]|nr:hypothetical protein [Candidatus Uhrbacteria bacterium]